MDEGIRSHDVAVLVEQHYALVYRYAYRLSGSTADAEDLTQQTFLTAQRKLQQLKDASKEKAWLCTIVRNAFYKSLRQQQSHETVPLDVANEPISDEQGDFPVDPEELQLALNGLPEEFRTTVVLFYFRDFSYREIAEQLEIPIGTVMSRLARGKTYLRNSLRRRIDVPETIS